MILRFLTVLLASLVLFGCDDDDGSGSDGDSVSIDVESEEKISSSEGGFDGDLDGDDEFGRAVARISDLDSGDRIAVAVGAPGDDREGNDSGAIWLLLLDEDKDSVVRSEKRIPRDGNDLNGGLDADDKFGTAVADLDEVTLDAGDDVRTTVAVGAPGDNDSGEDSGAVWLLALDDESRVEEDAKITFSGNSDFVDVTSGDEFGTAVARVDFTDGEGVVGLAVGGPRAKVDNSRTGAVWLLSLTANGSIASSRRIPDDVENLRDALSGGDRFGSAIAEIGDLDGDGVNEIAVGAPGDKNDQGAVWILFMNESGSVIEQQKISEDDGNFFGNLSDDAGFGSALAATGDLDDDGNADLAVGAPRDTSDGDRVGAVWVLFLSESGKVLAESKITESKNGFKGPLTGGDRFGAALSGLQGFDLGDSSEIDLAAGAPGDDDGGGNDSGAVWLLSIDVESEGDSGLLGSRDDRSDSDDSLLGGILRDEEFAGPLNDAKLGSSLRKREISSPLREREFGRTLRKRKLNSPLR